MEWNGRIRGLKRRASYRQPKVTFHIFCEGERTEPEYFSALKRKICGTIINIQTWPKGTPRTTAKAAKSFARTNGGYEKRKKINSFEARDQIWVAFDRDTHPYFEETVEECRHCNINVARSNPCFEVWLILHYENFDKYLDHHQVQEHYEKLDTSYNRNTRKSANCEFLLEKIYEAEKRATHQIKGREEEGNPFGNPSTTVGYLVREIIDAVNKFSPNP